MECPATYNEMILTKDSVTGRLIPARHAAFADDVMQARKDGDVWVVVEKIVDFWKSENPTEYRSLLVEVPKLRKSRARSSGASKSKNTRFLADIPLKIIQIIQTLYGPEELPLDKRFFREFARRFPEFRVAERL